MSLSSPRLLCRVLAGYFRDAVTDDGSAAIALLDARELLDIGHELEERTAVNEAFGDEIARLRQKVADAAAGKPDAEARTALMQAIVPSTDVKPTGAFELGEALSIGNTLPNIDGVQVAPDRTYTVKGPDDTYRTVLSIDDTARVLRGEPASNFEEQFVTAALTNFMSRPVIDWSDAGDRIVLRHR